MFILATGFSAPKKSAPVYGAGSGGPGAALGIEELERRAERLLAEYGIDLESRVPSGAGEITLVGTSADPLFGGRFIAVCAAASEGDAIAATRLLAFRDEVKASGATKGLFITDGSFPSDALFLLEDAPISLLTMGHEERSTSVLGSAVRPRRPAPGLR